MRIGKEYNFKIAILLVSTPLLLMGAVYPCYPAHSLRIPIGKKSTLKSMHTEMSKQTKADFATSKKDLTKHINPVNRNLRCKWPLDMSKPDVFLGTLYNEKLPTIAHLHEGIDIHAPIATQVFPVEDGIVVFTDTVSYGFIKRVKKKVKNMLENLVDVYVYSDSSKILWVYIHLDKNSVKNTGILTSGTQEVFNNKSNIKTTTNHTLGSVGKFPVVSYLPLGRGRRRHHLHLQAIYLPNGKTDLLKIAKESRMPNNLSTNVLCLPQELEKRGRCINPFPLLEKFRGRFSHVKQGISLKVKLRNIFRNL
ncbi:MAG: M23 family metallopeptidase [Candidatus Omnitrophica bacterium]|nr:M23 family metallopeptidase [Candidatus Omnitrophota bacterium]